LTRQPRALPAEFDLAARAHPVPVAFEKEPVNKQTDITTPERQVLIRALRDTVEVLKSGFSGREGSGGEALNKCQNALDILDYKSPVSAGKSARPPETRRKPDALSATTANECPVIDLVGEVIACTNLAEASLEAEILSGSVELEALKQSGLASSVADQRLLLLQRMCAIHYELLSILKAQLSGFIS